MGAAGAGAAAAAAGASALAAGVGSAYYEGRNSSGKWNLI